MLVRLMMSVMLLVCLLDRSASSQSSNVKEAIDIIVLFCVAGGERVSIEGKAKIEGGLALRKLGVTAGGDIDISKSEARGLVDGLRQEMSKISADNASEARKCMQPYIQQILNIVIGKSSQDVPPDRRGSIVIAWLPSQSPCRLNFEIQMNGQVIIPQQQYNRVENIKLGSSRWVIRGNVGCADGTYCQSYAEMQSGYVELREGGTYTFYWNVGPGSRGSECQFSLVG